MGWARTICDFLMNCLQKYTHTRPHKHTSTTHTHTRTNTSTHTRTHTRKHTHTHTHTQAYYLNENTGVTRRTQLVYQINVICARIDMILYHCVDISKMTL